MKKTATIILNRNLPKETDLLVEHLRKFDNDYTDIFVVEAGSVAGNISKYCTWHVETEEAIKHGLRYSRGMNYGLLKLWEEDNWKNYDSFFLITNDTKFPKNQKLCFYFHTEGELVFFLLNLVIYFHSKNYTLLCNILSL